MVTIGGVVQGIKDVAKILVTHPVKSFVTGARAIADVTTIKAPAGSRIVGGVVPIGPAGAAGGLIGVARGGAGIIRTGFGKISQFIAKNTINPLAGTTLKGGLATIGKATLGGGIIGGLGGIGFGIARAGITGEGLSPKKILQSTAVGLGLGLSRIGGALGALTGFGEETAKIIKEKWAPSVPDVYVPPTEEFNMPVVPLDFNIPDLSSPMNVTYTSPAITMTSPSVSMSVPSAPDVSPLLLALLGGGLGGYLLGRKKRRKKRKKRYKKRKR